MKLLEKDESLQLLGSRKPMATRAPGPTWAKNFLHFGCYQKQKLAGQKQKGTELELQTWTQVIYVLHLELLIFFAINSFVFVFSNVTATLKHTFMESFSSNISHLTRPLHILYW